MQTLYLHIGSPKTGTTALQCYLEKHSDHLKSRGFLYPGSTVRGCGHHDLAFLTGGGYPDWATKQDKSLHELLDLLKNDIDGWSGDMVLSSENFYLLSNPEAVYNALSYLNIVNKYEIKIIAYVRRQDDAHLSWYNQAVKAQGYAGTFEESYLANKCLWDYYSKLHEWEQVFGDGSVEVRVYEKEKLYLNDICMDFLKVINACGIGAELDSVEVNTRINADIMEFQRLINKLPLSIIQKRKYHKELIQLTKVTSDGGIFSDCDPLGRTERVKIMQSYADSNKMLSNKYFNGVDVFNAVNEMPEDDEGTIQKGLSVDKVVYIFGWLMANATSDN